MRGLGDIAAGLARTAGLWRPHLVEHTSARSGVRMVAAEDYDAWLLRWPARTSVTRHDHGDSSGAFTVVSGELLEVRWRGTLRWSRLVAPGDVVTIDRGIVHDVIAAGTDTAFSVHVYSPPLTAMGYYDELGTLVDRQLVDRELDAHQPVDGLLSREELPRGGWRQSVPPDRTVHPAGTVLRDRQSTAW